MHTYHNMSNTNNSRHNTSQRVPARFSVCMFTSFPRCGPMAIAPSAPMSLSAVHNAHIPQHVKHQQQPPAQHIATRTLKVQRLYVHQLPQMWTRGHSSFITDPVIWLHKHTYHNMSNTNNSHRHNTSQRVQARFSVCMFTSFPRCGPMATAPSTRIAFPALAQCTHTTTCQTPTTATGTTHRNAYSQGSAFACSPASPDVDPWPQLLHHRSCYLVAQAYIPQQVKHQQQPPAQYIATRTSKVQSMNAHQRVENLTRSRRFDVLHHFTNENITQQGQGSHTCVIDTPQKGCHAQTCFHAFNDDAPTSSRRNKAAAKGASWSC